MSGKSQFEFNWDNHTPIEQPKPNEVVESSSAGLGNDSGERVDARRQRSLRTAVEQILKSKGISYVDVREAKKSVFGSATLRAFHFVVYQKAGNNWLICATRLCKATRGELKEWEKVFGEGFTAVIARWAKDQTVKFRSLSGDPMTLR